VTSATTELLSLAVATWGGCRDKDPEQFYPTCYERGRQITTREEIERTARTLCGGCPVRAECLEWALRTERKDGYSHGIWGGLTGWKRQELIAARWPKPGVKP
jgi:WhiB family redox-sensing transcriptional regulator